MVDHEAIARDREYVLSRRNMLEEVSKKFIHEFKWDLCGSVQLGEYSWKLNMDTWFYLSHRAGTVYRCIYVDPVGNYELRKFYFDRDCDDDYIIKVLKLLNQPASIFSDAHGVIEYLQKEGKGMDRQ